MYFSEKRNVFVGAGKVFSKKFFFSAKTYFITTYTTVTTVTTITSVTSVTTVRTVTTVTTVTNITKVGS